MTLLCHILFISVTQHFQVSDDIHLFHKISGRCWGPLVSELKFNIASHYFSHIATRGPLSASALCMNMTGSV